MGVKLEAPSLGNTRCDHKYSQCQVSASLGFVVEWSGNESMRKRVLSCYESYDQVDIFGYGQGQEE